MHKLLAIKNEALLHWLWYAQGASFQLNAVFGHNKIWNRNTIEITVKWRAGETWRD